MNTRLKDAAPIETVSKIRNILSEIGILTMERWIDSGMASIYSVRVSIAGTDIGTNGKGATEELALASGYGEFMERLQNGLLFSPISRSMKPSWYNAEDIPSSVYKARSPIVDGVLYGMKSIAENCKEGLNTIVDMSKNHERWCERLASWANVSHEMGKEDGMVKSVCYEDLTSGEKAYLPVKMLCAYGSHGMAAGNSYKEAIVQGISEIFERHCQKMILEKRMCPPIIPVEQLDVDFLNISKYKEYIEAHKELRVQLRDCSLGEGFPVYCICIENVKTHCFAVTFGSHPNPNVAMERLFTEVFQGRTIRDIGNRICKDAKPEPYNTKGLFKNSLGHYPMEFWSDSPSYDVDQELLHQRFYANEDAYVYCLSLCRKKGIRVFVRDAGYLGFPAVQIICPGMSEVLCWDDFVLRHARTSKNVSSMIRRYHSLNATEKRLILEFVDFDRKVGLAFSARHYLALGLTVRGLQLDIHDALLVFLAKVAIDLCEFARARSLLERLCDIHQSLCVISDWCKMRACGYGDALALSTLRKFYEEVDVDTAISIVAMSPKEMIDESSQFAIEERLSPIVAEVCRRGSSFQENKWELLLC